MAGFISAGDNRKLRRRYDMNTYKTVKLYLQNWEYADENGQQEDYRASLKANIACKEAVEAAIVKHYHVNGYTLDTKNCAKELILEFGLERLAYVLANTLRYKRYDGRISPENLRWAYTVSVVFEMQNNMNRTVNSRFVVDKCNLGLTDLLVTQVRELQTLKNSAAKKQ